MPRFWAVMAELCQPLQGCVQPNELRGLFGREYKGLIQRHCYHSAAALVAQVSACVIDQDPAHGLRSNCEEMGPALPVHRPLLDQLEIGLMNQGGGLQGVLSALAAHVSACQAAQFVVDDRNQPGGSGAITIRQLPQESSDLFAGRILHAIPSLRLNRFTILTHFRSESGNE